MFGAMRPTLVLPEARRQSDRIRGAGRRHRRRQLHRSRSRSAADSVLDRFMTLFGDDPLAVYYRARGVQLDLTFTQLLFDYPFGAGLGRWGMAAPTSATPALPAIWAEIQITGWMIDGGVLMIVLYTGALVVAALASTALAMQTRYPRHRASARR